MSSLTDVAELQYGETGALRAVPESRCQFRLALRRECATILNVTLVPNSVRTDTTRRPWARLWSGKISG